MSEICLSNEAEYGQRSETKHIAVSYSIFPITPLPHDPCRMDFLPFHKLYSKRSIESDVSLTLANLNSESVVGGNNFSKENRGGHSKLFARIKV